MSDDPDEWHETYVALGYVLCRPHGEYHRPPECPIDEQGRPAPTWEEDDDQAADEPTISVRRGGVSYPAGPWLPPPPHDLT